MLLSIIVPVYNVEKYLNRCVDSLLDQGDFSDYEVILVDDGSTDSSGKICDDYAERFEVVRTIHKENGGLSSARNVGIKAANGNYVMFVDSDDYIKSCIIFELLEIIESNRLDILIYNFSYIYDKYDVKENVIYNTDISHKVMSGEQYMLENLSSQTMHMMACNKIYKKSLIIENQLYFREGFVHEDEEWSPRILYISNRVLQTDMVVYGYCIRKNSISNNDNNCRSALDLIENCKKLSDFSQHVKNPELKEYLQDNIAMLCLSAFYKGRLINEVNVVVDICQGLYLRSRNKKKLSLAKKNPKLYFKVNDIIKCLQRINSEFYKFPNKIIAVKSIISQKIHKYLREVFVTKKQRNKLKNHSFSIISNTCNGGVITSELGEQFRTPTINLWLNAEDFIKLVENLRYYMSLDVQEVKNSFFNYPVGRVNDIDIHFMHYKDFATARKKWNERKKRINYDNIYLLMAERDGCNFELIQRFDNLPYSHKVIFTAKEYPGIKSSIFVEKYKCNNEVDILTDYVGLTGRKYDEYFDYVDWLNKGEYKHLL